MYVFLSKTENIALLYLKKENLFHSYFMKLHQKGITTKDLTSFLKISLTLHLKYDFSNKMNKASNQLSTQNLFLLHNPELKVYPQHTKK